MRLLAVLGMISAGSRLILAVSRSNPDCGFSADSLLCVSLLNGPTNLQMLNPSNMEPKSMKHFARALWTHVASQKIPSPDIWFIFAARRHLQSDVCYQISENCKRTMRTNLARAAPLRAGAADLIERCLEAVAAAPGISGRPCVINVWRVPAGGAPCWPWPRSERLGRARWLPPPRKSLPSRTGRGARRTGAGL